MQPSNQSEISVERSTGATVVRLRGEVKLPNLRELREVLMEQLPSGRTVEMDLGCATAIDVCGLQLMCSAHRTFRKRSARFALQQKPDWLRTTASAAGYDPKTSVCPFRNGGDCLWMDEAAI